MASNVKYMIDAKGEKTSVLVPIKTWEKMQQDHAMLHKKLKVLTSIKQGMNEVREARNTGKKLQTLKDFLRESNR